MFATAHAHACHVLIVLEAIDFLGLVRRRARHLQLLLQFLNLRLIKLILPLKLIINIQLMLFMHFLDLFLKFLNLLILSRLYSGNTCLKIIHFGTQRLVLCLLLLVVSDHFVSLRLQLLNV